MYSSRFERFWDFFFVRKYSKKSYDLFLNDGAFLKSKHDHVGE
jgi:hypothetical protein